MRPWLEFSKCALLFGSLPFLFSFCRLKFGIIKHVLPLWQQAPGSPDLASRQFNTNEMSDFQVVDPQGWEIDLHSVSAACAYRIAVIHIP